MKPPQVDAHVRAVRAVFDVAHDPTTAVGTVLGHLLIVVLERRVPIRHVREGFEKVMGAFDPKGG